MNNIQNLIDLIQSHGLQPDHTINHAKHGKKYPCPTNAKPDKGYRRTTKDKPKLNRSSNHIEKSWNNCLDDLIIYIHNEISLFIFIMLSKGA